MSKNQQNALIPDPREYWESSSTAGYFYRDPLVGAIGPDGTTFVPPQTAPTPSDLLSIYLAQGTSPVSTNPAANMALPAPPSRGQRHTGLFARIAPLGTPGPSRAGRARGGFQFHSRGGEDHWGQFQSTQAGFHPRGMYPRGGRNQGGQSRGSFARAARQYNPVSLGAEHPRVSGSHAPMAQMQVTAPLASAPPVIPTAPFVAVPPPDVNVATRNPDGHPAFPFASPSDAPMADVIGVVMGAQERANAWHRSETNRIETWGSWLTRGHVLPRPPRPIDPALVGVWMGASISTLAQAENLLRWSDVGCPHAWAMVQFIEQDYGLRPLAYRSMGVGLILSSQAGSRNRYIKATTGAAPSSKKAARRAAAAARSVTIEDIHAGATGTIIIPAPDVAVPGAVEEDVEMGDIAAYLGTSPAGDDTGDFNSRMSVEEANAHWVSLKTSQWPKALRNAKGELPKLMNDVPFTNDSRVAFTYRIFGPTTGISLAEFIAKSTSMFSCAGMFDEFCRVGGYRLLSRGAEHYNFITTNLDWSLMASWWCTHGIAPGSPAVLAFESYSRSHRNQIEGHADPENTEFVHYPNKPSCVATLPSGHIIPWERIAHGPLYGSLQSTYPRRPSELVSDDDDMDGRTTPKQDRVDWSLGSDPTRPAFKFGKIV
ncbi:hypothetical protein C8F04DRAFT_1205012 [Mycena alexandri]|uniref:Uncharacterized protein n=1 Tax=Mycena alexandri TaxID=1745969 RepID=A0AAD6WLP4_9AGAR|nr:hypothetical protein C8F04DRAFT_1205012 [Mycena alexandri]